MKRFIFLLTTIFICTIARADNVNINWIVDDNTYATTQCEMGNDLILPTTPTKTGYTFRGWRIAKYIPIEYLESTGTQWIDTGVVMDINKKIDIDFMLMKIGSIGYDSWFGAQNGAERSIVAFEERIYCGNGNNRISCPVSRTQAHKISVNYNRNYLTIFLDDNYQSGTQTSGLFPFKTFYIFRINGGDGSLYGRIFYFKYYSDDVLVRDFIPVLDGDGVPCMYDKVEGKFYYNAGTGQFIAGPIITD